MKRYKPSTHRVGFAMAALLMMVITFGLFVVVPAELDLGSRVSGADETTQAASGVPAATIAVRHQEHAIAALREQG